MTHYRLSDSSPSAIILARNPRTSSLDELKSYTGNNIFLNNGDEFQIKLFNPLREKIGVQISFNGQSSNSLLVLNPGEDVIVDRFIDEKRKMLFETYQYDASNPAAKSAVANNGIVEIKFFKEYIYIPPIYTTGTLTINGTITTNSPSFTTLGNVGGVGSVGTSGSGLPHYTNSSSKLSSKQLTSENFADFDPQNHNSRMYDANLFNCCVQESVPLDFASDIELETKSETGRVEKGQISEQDFKSIEIQFQTIPFHVITYLLKPTSEKSTYHREVREYCTQCGYRVRNNSWMFCPKCGNTL